MPAPVGAETAAAPKITPARTATVSPRYTVHLLSTTEQDDLSRTVNAYELGSGAAYYQLGANYRLIYGAYPTVAAAREALETLPAGLQRYKPWVNNYPAQVVVMHFETPATLVSSAKPEVMPSR
jgi:septal ring-binding cell division protein DamX